MNIQKIKTKKIEWIHINKPRRSDTEFLKERFNFHPLDLEDCLIRVQRPQISEYSNYIFFILTFPVYNRAAHEIESSEVDFFITDKEIVTITDGKIPTIANFFDEVKGNDYARDKYMSVQHPVYILYEILHRLQNYTFPMLDHISQDIEDIEQKIFRGEEKKMVREILHVKRNIVDFRRIMQAHKNIIKKLMGTSNRFFMHEKMDVYFTNILERTKDIWDILETQKENINAFQETNEALISNKLNDIMRVLTVISVVLMPANLVATIFGMNLDNPVMHLDNAFYLVITLVCTVIILMSLFFKRKDWL